MSPKTSCGSIFAVALLLSPCFLVSTFGNPPAGKPVTTNGLPESVKTQQAELSFDPLDFPVSITQKLMCQSCYAAIKEMHKRIPGLFTLKSKMSRELLLFDAMEHFCEENNFFEYTGFPLSFVKGCKAFMDRYNDDSMVERRMLQAKDVRGMVASVCKEVCAAFPEADRHSTYTLGGEDPTAGFGRSSSEEEEEAEFDPILTDMDFIFTGPRSKML